MKELIVKCSECGEENNLGEKALKQYESAFAFQLDMKCSECRCFIGENESDYFVKGGGDNEN